MTTIGPALEGAPSLLSVAFDLGAVGYSTYEHFVTGTASAYGPMGSRPPDGRWKVTRSGPAAEFTTRLVVYGPTDPARANGTVVVEWLNVTGGIDTPAVWMASHRHLRRAGCTWVGVSVQRVGIEGGGVMPGMGLRQTDPERYEPLRHPGDGYAFDIFTEVGRALPALLADHGLPAAVTIATGASQSAFYLTTYVNAIDPHAGVFDGFLLQGRAGVGAPVEGWDPDVINPAVSPDVAARRAHLAGEERVRDDTRAPVLVVQSETDVFGALAYLAARQPDTGHFRLWEVAGAAHCDTYFLVASPQDSGSLPDAQLAALVDRADAGFIPTAQPINSGPQMHYVLQRALDALDRWVRTGTAPPSAPRLETDSQGALVVDSLGLGRGGVRTPWVDAPTKILSGLGQTGALTDLFGTTRPLPDGALAERYPGGRADYLGRFAAATRAAVEAGFLLEVDATEIDALGALAAERVWPGS